MNYESLESRLNHSSIIVEDLEKIESASLKGTVLVCMIEALLMTPQNTKGFKRQLDQFCSIFLSKNEIKTFKEKEFKKIYEYRSRFLHNLKGYDDEFSQINYFLKTTLKMIQEKMQNLIPFMKSQTFFLKHKEEKIEDLFKEFLSNVSEFLLDLKTSEPILAIKCEGKQFFLRNHKLIELMKQNANLFFWNDFSDSLFRCSSYDEATEVDVITYWESNIDEDEIGDDEIDYNKIIESYEYFFMTFLEEVCRKQQDHVFNLQNKEQERKVQIEMNRKKKNMKWI